MEIARETKIVWGLCCMSDAHYGSTPGVWGGPIWVSGFTLISWSHVPLSAQGPLGSEAPGLSIKGCYYHCLKYGANPWKQGWATAERGHAQEGQQGSQDTCVYAVLTNMSQTMSRMGSTC